jgi:hypothetical protein
MILKTGAINALLAYELLKSCQKESDELKTYILDNIENKFGLTGETVQERFNNLKIGIELYYYYIYKKKDYSWESIDMSWFQFEQLRISNMEKHKEIKKFRDSYKTYQSNRIMDLIKHYQYLDHIEFKNTNDDLYKKMESHIKMSKMKLLAVLEFLDEHELITEISKY